MGKFVLFKIVKIYQYKCLSKYVNLIVYTIMWSHNYSRIAQKRANSYFHGGPKNDQDQNKCNV